MARAIQTVEEILTSYSSLFSLPSLRRLETFGVGLVNARGPLLAAFGRETLRSSTLELEKVRRALSGAVLCWSAPEECCRITVVAEMLAVKVALR